MAPKVIAAPGALPRYPGAFSILSFNVLLPNSMDGWWMYKMYAPGALLDPEEASWPRRAALIREEIRAAGADVVCLQEVCPESFETDFAFMEDLGYTGKEMFRKGRFRPATFWRPSVELTASAHRDRALVSMFKLAGAEGRPPCAVVNCHLQAGPEGARRLRQAHEALEFVFKAAKKAGHPDPARAPCVVAGDLNGDERSAAVALLERGEVGPDFLEDGEAVTSKPKKSPFPPMVDASAAASEEREPPATLVVADLIPLLTEGGDEGRSTRISAGAAARLREVFADRAGPDGVMRADQVSAWLVTVNGALGRGSEFRAACAEMAASCPGAPAEVSPAPAEAPAEAAPAEAAPRTLPPDGFLTADAFVRIYEKELRAGKYWGVAHDLQALGRPLPEFGRLGLFKARFDRVYASAGTRVLAVRDRTSDAPCPNAAHASDHLPVGAVVEVLPLPSAAGSEGTAR